MPVQLPTFQDIARKRPREEQLVMQPVVMQPEFGRQNAQMEMLASMAHFGKELVAQIRDEEPKKKTEVVGGLKVVEEGNDTWIPFQLYTQVAMIKTVGRERTGSVVANWKTLMTDPVVTHLPKGCKPQAMLQYSQARDDMSKWLIACVESPLSTKDEWSVGYSLLFNLIDTFVVMRNDSIPGKTSTELRAEFNKANAVIDISSYLDKVFQRRGGGRRGDQPPANKKDPNATTGLDKPSGAPGERKCNRCNKYHTGPWRMHKCK